MSRFDRFLKGTIAGYGNMAANIALTLLSIPLALKYLDKEQFGLWALAAQISSYLLLIELGTSNALTRFLADHKDDVNGGEYGSQLLTGGLVFVAQGSIIAGVGIMFSQFAPGLFAIGEIYENDFKILLIILSLTTGTNIALRAIQAPLWSFQRLDFNNICLASGTLVSIILLWLGFVLNLGIYAYPVSQLPQLIIMPIASYRFCKKNGYYPERGKWGKFSWAKFLDIIKYGKDVLMVQIGGQLINASQIIIISRYIGLDEAAIFAISTKIYGMGQMFIGNPISIAYPALTEIYVRNDLIQFRKRFWDLTCITLMISTLIAIGIATGNRTFVSIWTNGLISWPRECDLVLAFLIIFKHINLILVNLCGVTKNWKPVRFAYVYEGLAFIILSIVFTSKLGMIGVLLASMLAHIGITTPIALASARHIIGSMFEIRKPLILSILFLCFSYLGQYLLLNNTDSIIILILYSAFCCILYLVIAWNRFLGVDIKNQITARINHIL